MTAAAPPDVAMEASPQEPPAVTPGLRMAARRSRFWVVLAVIAVLVVATGTVLAGVGSSVQGAPLAADNPAPAGAQALAAVLRQHGVTVIQPVGYDEATAALDDSAATLLLFDPSGHLEPDRLRTLRDAATTTVIVAPGFDGLEALLPGVSAAGTPQGTTLSAGCALPAAQRAGTVRAGDRSFRVAEDSAEPCFADASGRALLVHDPDTSTTAIAAPDILENEGITAEGNAALALGLLGEHERLVWYLPTIADAAGGAPPSRAELTPGWVTPSVVVLIAAALAAALWRGRRLGPLVIENLPVTVPARETMEGRARLYARSSSRLRALDALRIGAVGRLASALGLARTATVDEVTDASAAAARWHLDRVRQVLLDAQPASDSELLDLATELQQLEHAVRTSPTVDPSRTAVSRHP